MRELALQVLDLVRNSIEAGATKVALSITEDFTADRLTIEIHDNGRGMNSEECRRALDPFVTSNHTRKAGVGLGLPLVDMYTRHCGGYLSLESAPGRGTTLKAVYQHSHLDRPPLGNMAETVKAIMVGNPKLDFCYSHTVGQRTFRCTTYELTGILGDIPLTHPDVLHWITDYLSGHFNYLYGGGPGENH